MDYLGLLGMNRNSSLRRALLAGTAIGLLLAPLPLAAEDFIGYERSPISTSVADWETDRSSPADFKNIGTFQGRENVLRLSSRPPAADASFWKYEGKNQRVSVRPGPSLLRGDLWVPESWRTSPENKYIRTGIWSSTMPEALVAKGLYNDNAAVFAVTHLTNKDSTDDTLHARAWKSSVGSSGLFSVLESAPLVRYGAWNTIELRVMPAENKDEYRVEYRLNGEVIFS